MKDLSLFLLKNTFGAKMRKSFKTFCNDDGSTSTLNQRQTPVVVLPDHDIPIPNNNVDKCEDEASSSSSVKKTRRRRTNPPTTPPVITLEDMIMKLEMEEEKATKGRRSSCVNNSSSDNMLLMSARDALNQYPRFSLDGKDAMYRSSFRNNQRIVGRRSVCCDYGTSSSKFGGERVVWCKPGVVAKLMGLEALPMPLPLTKTNRRSTQEHPRRMLLLGTTHLRRQIT